MRTVLRTSVMSGVLLAAATWPAAMHAETARQMLDGAHGVIEARKPKDVFQRMRMTLRDARGAERVRDLETRSKNFGKSESKSILFFLSPSDVKGVGLLAWAHPARDDDQWLYLPELARVRRISTGG